MAEAEQSQDIWLVVAEGEGCGETRIVMGDDAMVDAILDMVEGHRGVPERIYWRDFVRELDNWTSIDRERRWHLRTEIGETGHLEIQYIDKQDMMDLFS